MDFHGTGAEKQEAEPEEQVPPRKRWSGCNSGLELNGTPGLELWLY